MSGSGRSFDYNLRIAKGLERHALAEVIRLAMRTHANEEYWYAGMGSFAFRDFTLFHKLFGFAKMFSAENYAPQEQRCRFNKPFPCVEFHPIDVDEMLRDKLDWRKRYVIWLDYDGPLEGHVFDALMTVATRALSGTLLLVTIRAEYPVNLGATEFTEHVVNELGEDRVERHSLKVDDFLAPKVADTLDRIIVNHLQEHCLNNVNAPPGEPVGPTNPLLFEYADGARMVTGVYFIGTEIDRGVFEGLVKGSQLRKFAGERPYRISVPVLLPRERRYLEQKLDDLGNAVKNVGIDPGQLKDFALIYRYWPYFAEVDI